MRADTPKLHGRWHPPRSDKPFLIGMSLLGACYVVLILAMLLADVSFLRVTDITTALRDKNIQYAIWLSLVSCCITTVLALWVSVPLAYLMSRLHFKGKSLIDAILDIPIVLPPLVIGLSLLILFRQTWIGRQVESWMPIAYHIPAVILAQFSVATAFATRTLRGVFDDLSPRREQVALTLGCSRSQAFWAVVLPECRLGLLTAGTLAWARSLGEFGPLLVFAGITRRRTEVLPVSVHLEISIGNIEGAVAISLIMIFFAVIVLIIMRIYGSGEILGKTRQA